MNSKLIYVLKVFRKLYRMCGRKVDFHAELPGAVSDPDIASGLIYESLISDSPCMIARYGSTELSCICNYLDIQSDRHGVIDFIKGRTGGWWWDRNIMDQMCQWSGFFPPDEDALSHFSQMMLEDSSLVDVLGSWVSSESVVRPYLKDDLKVVHLRLLEPFWSEKPWTRALEGKKVLVVHPFASLIEEQYRKNRTVLFNNPGILPEFDLFTVKAVQSIGGVNNGHEDWFSALEWMKSQIDKVDYDICLIGCGAYGFPLAAHVKRQGKKAVHIGGALQLLFGIRGNRWDNPEYGVKEWGIPVGTYSNLVNRAWVRPGEESRPATADRVESACYW